jgi:uncharacterized protein HemY
MPRLLNSIFRVHLLCCAGLLAACAQQPLAIATPQGWEPAYWHRTLLAIKNAQQRGDKPEAERLCSRLIPYAQAQGIKALYDHAKFLDAQQPGSGADARARAERLTQVTTEHARAAQASNSTYLGFAPWDDLTAYADALQRSGRPLDAQEMRALAQAYQYGQAVHVNRSLLMQQGKSPLGEC